MPAPSQVTIDDIAAQLGINQRGAPVDALLTRCLDATVAYLVGRLGPWVAEPWPANVEQAVVMQSARLYKRRNSPEGVAGFGDLGIVTVTSFDPDIESLINADLAWYIGGTGELVPVTPAGEVHVGPDAPDDDAAVIWVDTDG